MHKLPCLFILCLVITACRSFKPPEHPLAGFFPTVELAVKLEELHKCEISTETLQASLENLALWQILQQAGLPQNALMLLKRGLQERGYAELDARRSATSLQWINFVCKTENEVQISAAFAGKPPAALLNNIELKSPPEKIEVEEFWRNANLERQYRKIWQSQNIKNQRFEIHQVSLDSPKNTQKEHWEIRQKINIP